MAHTKKRDVILFIDDEKICHTLVELIIPNFTEFKLVSAFNGQEALDLAKRYSNELCLILSDITLSDINGYDLFNLVRKDAKLKSIPFIFQSGLAAQEESLRKNIAEEIKILYKPYKQEDLLKAINEAVLEVQEA